MRAAGLTGFRAEAAFVGAAVFFGADLPKRFAHRSFIAADIRLPRIPRTQKELLQPHQIRQLIEALPWQTQAIAILMVAGSLRFGEVAGLRWKRVLENRVEIRERFYEGTFDDTKTDARDPDVPLDPVMKAALEKVKTLSHYRKSGDGTDPH